MERVEDDQRMQITVHGPGFDSSPVPRGHRVVLLRNAKKLSRGRGEARLLRNASLGVYDLDDGLPWDDGNLDGLGRWWKRPWPRSLIARRAASAAHRVIAGNDVLAEWASNHCDDVRVVPTCIEPRDYVVRADWEIGNAPRLGWIGSPATEHYLEDIAPALADIHRRFGATVELISGPGVVPPALASFTTRVQWSPSAHRRIREWDVGLMPLHDGVYERAKCGYKLLQYAASGVPAIGSPVGVNSTILRRMSGLAPRTVDEWRDALAALLTESAADRERRAVAGLRTADEFSYDRWRDVWLAAVGADRT
jgi:glycosyltransferase involved in cell wall biosynthesis